MKNCARTDFVGLFRALLASKSSKVRYHVSNNLRNKLAGMHLGRIVSEALSVSKLIGPILSVLSELKESIQEGPMNETLDDGSVVVCFTEEHDTVLSLAKVLEYWSCENETPGLENKGQRLLPGFSGFDEYLPLHLMEVSCVFLCEACLSQAPVIINRHEPNSHFD